MRLDTRILFTLAGIAGVVYLLTKQSSTSSDPTSFSSDPIASLGDTVMSTITGWKSVGQGSTWVPVLNAVEIEHGIPTDLLARVAYQESHFREDIIRGVKPSPAGALGIMQMLPQYFASVRVPVPFTDDNVNAQIEEAAGQLVDLYGQLGNDWALALAGYNAGAGNVKKYGGIPPFTETQNYVSQIMADLPEFG